ncbi:hypothetical protein LMTR13_11430 [Bradyrhizobium icense]|uniref:Uncharacterized protein n=1 Tax=Bradyrhizobium icense TaxID=1274631 RepID=A0A1B1UD81_9BRAD|nr:hypothetical protein LMTR13_11430 [Bradyrhizobium icense]
MKMRVAARIPAQLVGGNGIAISKANGVYTFDLDYTEYAEILSFDPATKMVLVYDAIAGYALVSLASLLTNSAAVRIVTEAGDITVANETQLLIMNRTADESPSNINLPASASKIGKIKVVDWKGNAGSFPHTVNPNGSEEFQGGLTSWSISSDGASAVFDPIPTGLGYAV